MLQGWFDVRIVKIEGKHGQKELKYEGITSGISIPIRTQDFDFDEKYAELKRYALADARVTFETKEVEIWIRPSKHHKKKTPLFTIIYFGEIKKWKPYKKPRERKDWKRY